MLEYIERLTPGRMARKNEPSRRICKKCFKAAKNRKANSFRVLPGSLNVAGIALWCPGLLSASAPPTPQKKFRSYHAGSLTSPTCHEEDTISGAGGFTYPLISGWVQSTRGRLSGSKPHQNTYGDHSPLFLYPLVYTCDMQQRFHWLIRSKPLAWPLCIDSLLLSVSLLVLCNSLREESTRFGWLVL